MDFDQNEDVIPRSRKSDRSGQGRQWFIELRHEVA